MNDPSFGIYAQQPRLFRWGARLSEVSYPVTVRLDLTDDCNHACPHCAFPHGKAYMPTEIVLEIIKHQLGRFSPFRVESLIFSGGGEPLLHQGYHEILETAAGRGFKVGVYTNGAATTCYDWGLFCSWVQVSLDAGSQEEYSRRHSAPPSDWELALSTIRGLRHIADKGGSLKHVSAAYLVGEDSSAETMREAARAARLAGAMAIIFRSLWARGRAVNFTAWAEQVKWQEEKNSDFRVLWPARVGETSRPTHCFAALCLQTVIGTDLRVWPCTHLRGIGKYCLGDLRSQSFGEVWEGAKRYKVMASLPGPECPPGCCHRSLNEQAHVFLREATIAAPHLMFI